MAHADVCWWPKPGGIGICGKPSTAEITSTNGDRKLIIYVCRQHEQQARKELG